MNVNIYVQCGSLKRAVPGILQTPTTISYEIAYIDGDRQRPRPWKDAAMAYLAWVKRSVRDRDVWKRQRKVIGWAWRAAEDAGGQLLFSVG